MTPLSKAKTTSPRATMLPTMAPTTMVRGIGVGQSVMLRYYSRCFKSHAVYTYSHTHKTHAPRVLDATYAGDGRLVALLLPLFDFFARDEVNDDFDQGENNQPEEDHAAKDRARHHPRVRRLRAH